MTDIASISAIEGKNWRHGDIEDILKTVACIKGHKWTSMMIKRVYFGYVGVSAAPSLRCSSLVLQELAQRLFTSYGHRRSEKGST